MERSWSERLGSASCGTARFRRPVLIARTIFWGLVNSLRFRGNRSSDRRHIVPRLALELKAGLLLQTCHRLVRAIRDTRKNTLYTVAGKRLTLLCRHHYRRGNLEHMILGVILVKHFSESRLSHGQQGPKRTLLHILVATRTQLECWELYG